MGRLYIIDGFRGFFLLFMGIVHFNGALATQIGKYNHHMLGWVEDAQGFVFISGLVVGLVYGKKYLRAPTPREQSRPVYDRIRTIYGHHLFLIATFLLAALVLGSAEPSVLEPYSEAPVLFTLGSMIFVSASMHMGILPMYIGFLAITPLAFRWLSTDRAPAFWALVAVAWLAAQTTLAGYLMYRAQLSLNDAGVPVRFGIYFNLLGWQILFFVGLFFGFRAAQKTLDLDMLRGPGFRTAFLISVAAIVALAFYDRALAYNLFGEDHTRRIAQMSSRPVLSSIYLVNFALDAFAITWLLVAGQADRSAWIRRLSGAIRWLFTRPALVFLGQHSLHVYTFHLLMFYAMATVLAHVELSELVRSAMLVAGTASLWLAAWVHSRMRERDAAPAEPRAAAKPVQAEARTVGEG